jgi:hypothetical protein
MRHVTAREQGLDPVFPENTERGVRIFYDAKEGKYYDSATDLYLENYDPKTALEAG